MQKKSGLLGLSVYKSVDLTKVTRSQYKDKKYYKDIQRKIVD